MKKKNRILVFRGMAFGVLTARGIAELCRRSWFLGVNSYDLHRLPGWETGIGGKELCFEF